MVHGAMVLVGEIEHTRLGGRERLEVAGFKMMRVNVSTPSNGWCHGARCYGATTE